MKRKSRSRTKPKLQRKGSRTVTTVTAPWRSTTVKSSSPSFNGKSTTRVVHREVVDSLRTQANGVFTLFPQTGESPGWDLAPGNATLFPWLSNIARNYEQYHFHRLCFRLISAQSAAVSGRVYMAIDYDWDDEIASNMASMMNNQSAVQGAVWSDLTLDANVKSMHDNTQWKYTMNPVREAPEPRTTFGGFLMIAYNTSTACSFDLVVEYDVEFRSPQGSGIPIVFSATTTSGLAPSGISPLSNYMLCKVAIPPLPGVRMEALPDNARYDQMSLAGSSAYDITSLQGGILALNNILSQPSLTPAAIMNSTALKPLKALFYDANYQYLGDLSSLGSSYTKMSQIAATNPSLLNTLGAEVVGTLTVPFLEVRKSIVLNAAKFLVFLWNFGASLVALNNPTCSTYVQYEL